jgi:hypothetical protein
MVSHLTFFSVADIIITYIIGTSDNGQFGISACYLFPSTFTIFRLWIHVYSQGHTQSGIHVSIFVS